jgi:hypothetical protein
MERSVDEKDGFERYSQTIYAGLPFRWYLARKKVDVPVREGTDTRAT